SNIQNKILNDTIGTKSQQNIEKPFCSTFDLTKSIPQNIILENKLMTLINLSEKNDEIIENFNPYNTLLNTIRKVIEENHFKVESFAGSPANTNAIYSATYHGLFHVHKLPTLNSLVPSSAKLSVLSGGGGNNLGFKLRRKKFTIETFHLPPEGGIGVSGSGCGTIPGRKVDPYDF
ncbi:5579_t:CDS:2, partial [Rhizophagus irregularis]